MKVSVIVPAFNAEATLEAAVNSLLATSYPDLEILIVDDGSHDGTLVVGQRLAAQHPDHVLVLTHAGGVHRGVSASRNLGICASSGELIAFLDADDLVLAHRFDHAVPLLCERSDVDGVYELTRIENRSQKSNNVDPQWRDGALFGIDEPLAGDALLSKLMTGIPWGTAVFLCRRTLFDRIGLFDETRSMAEDCHLWIRAAASAMILPAEPLHVVSLYVRHDANSYQYSLERRINLLDAMADAGDWIKSHAQGKWITWITCFNSYAVRCILSSREAGRLDIAAETVRVCIRYGHFATLLHWQFFRQLIGIGRDFVNSRLHLHLDPYT